MSILSAMPGTTQEKSVIWASTYDHITPPPAPALVNDEAFAFFLANNYTGPNPCPEDG
jgi:hypothetical protein